MPDRVLNFDELNIITREQIRDKVEAEIYSDLPDRKVDRKRCEDIIFDLLTMAYAYGLNKAGLDLQQDLPVNEDQMKDSVYEATAGKTAFERMSDHIDAASPGIEAGGPTAVDAATRLIDRLTTLIETEQIRVENEAILDGGDAYKRKNPDKTVMKRWVAVIDDRTRDTHFYLDGTIVPLDAYFYSYSGDKALHPHGFSTPEEQVNCRCTMDLIVY